MTREQFRKFIDAYVTARKKEHKVNAAFESIWDDLQGQHTPFYISEFRTALDILFSAHWGIEFDDSTLDWYMDCIEGTIDPGYTIGKDSYEVRNADDFYDYLVRVYGDGE